MMVNQQVRDEVISHVIRITTRCTYTHWTYLTNIQNKEFELMLTGCTKSWHIDGKCNLHTTSSYKLTKHQYVSLAH